MSEQIEMVKVKTRKCIHCGEDGEVTVPKSEWEKWDLGRGPHIQVAMPRVSADIREQILSGTHGKCWDALFAGMDEED